MDKPNKELLQAFIDWFMREYSNFGGKPIAERYEEAFDTFNNDFIDARYDAFQDGWKVQQAKVEELQSLYTQQGINMLKLQKRVDAAIEAINEHYDSDGMSGLYFMDLKEILEGEQALKGEG